MNTMDRELFEAAEENNVPEVRRLVSDGADVNSKDNYGSTPLHMASCEGYVEVFHVLREHGADIDAKDNQDSTPLHLACGFGHLAVVNELLSPNDSNGATTSILGKRKSRGANIEAKDNAGDTPLHDASWHGHLVIVKALLAVGADSRAINNNGQLPIHRAVIGGKSEVGKYLLQHFYYATSRRLPLHGLLEDLTWNGDRNSSDVPPLRAALDENVFGTDDVVEILEYLVDQNPEFLSSRDQDGLLPLHVACRRGVSFAIVESLVNLNKASVKRVTSQGDLPLFLACEVPEPSLDTIFFILMKLYPDVVYHRCSL
jgi:ankyrin repeat protein